MKKFFYKTISLLSIAILIVGITATAIKAQEVDETSTDTPSETTNTLRERIEKIVEQQKEKVESVLGEFPNQMRGFVGQVVKVSETTLTLENRGVSRIVPLNEALVLMRSGSKITADKIEIDSWALVLGKMENNSFVPKKISFSVNSLLPKQHIVYLGSVKDITAKKLDFQPRGQEKVITTALTTKTAYQNSEGVITRSSEFVEDDQVLLIGYQDENEIIITVIRALAPSRNE
ncbi:MAG: hypothetical protein ABII10_02340 [Candidatus Paceibacterota bacterium]